MKQVIVNYAEPGRENYLSAQERLIDSFKAIDWEGDYLFFSTQEREYRGVEIKKVDFTPHSENPYGFKLEAILRALKLGYRQIMWADSTIVAMADLTPLFDYAATNGVTAFHNLGHNLHGYIHDKAADYFGIIEDPEFKEIPQIMACAFIFDFENEKAELVWAELTDAYDAGIFKDGNSTRPDFKAHRHDQAALSALLWKYGISLLPYGNLVYEPHDKTKEYGEDIYLLNKAV